MKKHIVLLTSLLLLASLIGCGQGSDAQNETSKQSERTTTAPVVTTSAPMATTTAEPAPVVPVTTTAPLPTTPVTTVQAPVTSPEPTEPQVYESLAYENAVIYDSYMTRHWLDEDLVIIHSNDELTALHLELDLGYSDDFFTENALALVQFTYSSGEELLELTGIVVKDGKLCPVLMIESQELLSEDFVYALISAEVKKADVQDYEAGENLIINQTFPNRGSKYHKIKFDGILK